jgi:hypothetical protein
MRSESSRGWIGVGACLGLVLAVAGCKAMAGSTPPRGTGGGIGQTMVPVGGGTGGSAGALAPTSVTAGAGAIPKVGTGGTVAGAQSQSTGGTTATGSAGTGAAGMTTTGSGGATQPEMPTDAGTTTTPPHGDLGKGDGSDVVTIGDSWMSILTNGGGIEGALDRAGTSYRHYSIAGTTLIGGDIPLQYGRAKGVSANIKTVIMTGGGNDIMFSGGCNTKEACQQSVQMIVDALDQLWSQMADDGVKDVIFIQYSANAGTSPKDTLPASAPTPPICLTGRITCHAVMTTDLVSATDLIDGIHPSLQACDLIAKRVLDLMDTSGIRR